MNPKRPSYLMQFLWFCAGANTQILLQCPSSEHNKMAGIGAAVLFTGILASVSGGYALYVAWQSIGLALLFGLFWGMVIFNLDRFMVTTLKRSDSPIKNLLPTIPRVLLALVLAMMIAKPLELRIFNSEINEILEDQKVVKLTRVELRYQDKVTIKEQSINRLEELTKEQFQLREKYYQDYKCECDGTCGTGKSGRGSECERKERRYLQANEEYQETKSEHDKKSQRIQIEIESIKRDALNAIEETEKVYSYGLVSRLSASNHLPLGPRVFIPLLILLVELSPILVKLLAPVGPYETGLSRIEEAYRLTQRELLYQQKMEIEKERKLMDNLHQAEIEETIAQKRHAIQTLSQAQLELMQQQIDKWLSEEKQRINEQDKNR